MKIYIQTNENNIITDVVTFPFGDYQEVEVQNIPQGIHGGWFKYENGEIIEYPELKPIDERMELEKLKQQQALMQTALDDLIFGGGF